MAVKVLDEYQSNRIDKLKGGKTIRVIFWFDQHMNLLLDSSEEIPLKATQKPWFHRCERRQCSYDISSTGTKLVI